MYSISFLFALFSKERVKGDSSPVNKIAMPNPTDDYILSN